MPAEIEASSDPASEEPVSVPAPAPEPGPAQQAPKSPAAVGPGKADSLLTGSSGVKGVSASSSSVAGAASTAAVAPGAGSGPPLLALIVFGLILVVAGGRLVFGPIEADSLRYSRFKLIRRAAPRG